MKVDTVSPIADAKLNSAIPRIASVEATRHILRRFNLRASKRLGQNFLIDAKIVRGIVAAAEIAADDIVLEIGPGIGTLTQGLAETGARIIAVELDKKLPAVLKETLKPYDNVTVIQGDILKVDILQILEDVSGSKDTPFKVVANLPYYITTPIIMTLLERRLPIERLLVMVQKEVALRMTALPNTADYGSLSVAVQYYTETRVIMDVPPAAFMPRPEVTSAVIMCRIRNAPRVKPLDERLFFRVTRSVFMQRRKTILNSLRGAGFTKDEVLAALAAAGIPESTRGETLTLEDFCRIADELPDKNSRGGQYAVR